MSASDYLDFVGLSDHPDADALGEDLHEAFAAAADSWLADLTSRDLLARALTLPCGPGTWHYVPCSWDLLRPGLSVMVRRVDSSAFHSGAGIGVIHEIGDHWMTVRDPNRSEGRFSVSPTDWADNGRARLPVPVDLGAAPRADRPTLIGEGR